jgi:hypothetical protein
MQDKELWPFLFFLGLFFFGWPLLAMVRIPLPYYLYAIWALFILILVLLVSIKSRGEKE